MKMTLSTVSNPSKTRGKVVTNQNGESTTSNVKVVVRVRPENSFEHSGCFRIAVKAMNEHVLVFDPKEEHMHTPGHKKPVTRDLRKRPRKDLKFAFDYVFGPHTSNQAVYEQTTKTILDGFLNGYNCSVFAYGATGAGKTHTMLGSADKPGVMYLTMIDLYDRINEIKEEKSCEIAISYLEVYNEQIRDLLMPKGMLPIREDANNGVIVSGLSLHKPTSAEELLHLLQFGNQNRSQHPTDANAESSRSHAVFQVFVRQKDRTANISAEVKVAKMCLVDLAGSERATVNTNRGVRFREGANINRSLLALGNVINALADNKSNGHIPYRDSKLTRLLKDSLGGNCRTVMIAAVSPSCMSYDDTYNTLKYADRATHIQATLKKNILNVDFHVSRYGQIVEDLRKEIIQLKSKLTSFEEQKIVSGGTSKLILNQEVVRLQDVLHNLFMTRLAVRKEMLNHESSRRDILYKIYKKEKTKNRIDLIETNNTQAKENLLRTVTKNKHRMEGLDKRIEIAINKFNENNGWLERVTTEMKLAGGDSKIIPEMLEVSLRMHNLEVELGDARHHSKHLKKLIKNQEREAEGNDRLISNLLKLVRKQHLTLKGHNILTPDLLDEYNQIKDEIDRPEISWADETTQQEVEGEKFHIADIYNLPVLSTLSLKGSTPSRVRNRRRSSLSPQKSELNETQIAAKVLMNSPFTAQRVPYVNSNPIQAGRVKENAPISAPVRNLNAIMSVDSGSLAIIPSAKSIPKDYLLRQAVLSANIVNQQQSAAWDNKKSGLCTDVSNLNKKFVNAYNARDARLINSKTYDFPCNDAPSALPDMAHDPMISEPPAPKVKSHQSVPGKSYQSPVPMVTTPSAVITPYEARENRPIKSRTNYKISDTDVFDETYVKTNETFTKISESNIPKFTMGNETIILSSPVVLKQNVQIIDTTTVSKLVPSHSTIQNQTFNKAEPDIIKPTNHIELCKKPVARSIVFESTPPSSKGMSYADVVKSPSPIRTPLQQINSNTSTSSADNTNRFTNVTPQQFKLNLEEYTPKYKLSLTCKENLKKLRQNMEKTQSNQKMKTNHPNYMSMTKSSAIRNRLQFKDDDVPMAAQRILVKSSLGRKMSKSKSTPSLNRCGWQI